MELKDTLLMPKTTFEMRGNLPVKEPLYVQKWLDEDEYNKQLQKNAGKTPFILHDGPPYANGNIHLGHALNKILKDFVVRYKNQQGFYTPFIPGWDTHGLPIENALTKSGVSRKDIPSFEFRELCAKYAQEQVAKQKDQFVRLGILADFKHPYLTLQKEFEAEQINVFATMALKGLIYKGVKPVYWSPSSESALAEAEIEYFDVEAHSIYVKFPVLDGKGIIPNDAYFVIWTTTPWTLPANLGISVHPDFEYGLYQTNQGKLVLLNELIEPLTTALKLEDVSLIKSFKGSQLEYAKAKHPFLDRESLLMVGRHVTSGTGTGLVHTAPGHGEDDFIIGKRYNLPIYCPVDSHGVLDATTGKELEGVFYEKANAIVLDILKRENALLADSTFKHSYPHDWRTKKPVIFRATDQWFCSIRPIRESLLEEIKKTQWTPSWGEKRMHNMIEGREDWCISRQRAWGVPIPIIYDADNKPIIDEKVFKHIEKLISEEGSNVWYKKDIIDLLPKDYAKDVSNYKKETDIMDVWFDSGSSSHGVVKKRLNTYPADLYFEGSDQYRGWFNSSLIIGYATRGTAPFKAVTSHGFIIVDGHEKMSKSAGNGIDPITITNTFGADILRLWVASTNYQADIKISMDLIKQVSEIYRKIRNTFKFLLGNLRKENDDVFDIKKDKVSSFSSIDELVINKLNYVVNQYLDFMNIYAFSDALSVVVNFLTNDLSSFYLDITKDVLYCDGINSLRRKQVQHTIYILLDTLTRLLNPFIPFTAQEVSQAYIYENAQSLEMPVSKSVDSSSLELFENLLKVRKDVLKALEEVRANGTIGSSQEALVNLNIKDEKINSYFAKLSKEELQRFFIVSKVELDTQINQEYETSYIKVEKHDGCKCERCWNRFSKLNDFNLCPRCEEVVNEINQRTNK